MVWAATGGGASIERLIEGAAQFRIVHPRERDTTGRRWLFTHELMQQACYQTLLKRDRRDLHAKTADALVRLADDPAKVAGDVLAYHEEAAERWDRAAAANLRAGEHAAGLFINDEAMRRFDRAIELATQTAEGDAAQLRTIAARAQGGAAGVCLLLGDYEQARQRAAGMRDLACETVERAEADRLLAAVSARTGDADEALRLLQHVVEHQATAVCHHSDVISRAWGDLAQIHHRAGRLGEALRCVQQSRDCICSHPDAAGVRADLLEGMILHTRGSFADACVLYERADRAASRLGSLSDAARATNCLGNAARDQGDYTRAREHYQRALATWSRMSDAESIAGARANLGNVAMSIGEFDDAGEQYQQALDACTQIGNPRGIALAHANLAILNLERGRPDDAVRCAHAGLASLGGGDRVMASLIRVVLGEALVDACRFDEAMQQFTAATDDKASDYPLAQAGARRGLGRVAMGRGAHAEAIDHFHAALAGYRGLNRTQEALRTQLLLAEAMAAKCDITSARQAAQEALASAESIFARRDAQRARGFLEQLPARDEAGVEPA